MLVMTEIWLDKQLSASAERPLQLFPERPQIYKVAVDPVDSNLSVYKVTQGKQVNLRISTGKNWCVVN